MAAEQIRLRIGDLGRAVLVTGQAYQDPKDALNEFVSNAADDYAESTRRGARIRIVLHRRGRHPVIAVEDSGKGMSPDRLREVARNLFNSSKADDPRTIGEKAIGMLAFQQIGARCDIVSCEEGSTETHVLRLQRGYPKAQLERERRRARSEPGTTVYIADLDPDVLRVLTLRKVVDYLRRRRGPALARGDYQIEVVEGRRSELVTPEEPDGVRLAIPARNTLWGRIEFAVAVSPEPDRHRRVSIVGAGGVTIIDDITEIEEFARAPWDSDMVSGSIAFDALKQTAGRRALLRDREAFPVFVDAVRGIEPLVVRTLERIAREVDAAVADRLSDAVRRIFGRVLKELADLENPMRTGVGSQSGEGGLFEPELSTAASAEALAGVHAPEAPEEPSVEDLIPPEMDPVDVSAGTPVDEARPSPGRSKGLPSIAPDPAPGSARSRFDAESGIVYFNDHHNDYLMVKSDEATLLDYLATLVAKEYVVYNNPRAAPAELGEEMVRMLVRVRRHLPKRA